MNHYNRISIRNILRPVKVRATKRRDNHINTKSGHAVQGEGEGKKMRSSHSDCLKTNDRM